MQSAEIQDSDPPEPPIDSSNPQWFPVSRSGTPVSCSAPALVQTPPAASPQETLSEPKATDAPRASTECTDRVDPVESNAAEENSAAGGNLRRRRFDFRQYVEEDRRVHEYVYHKRFRDYQGARSDSEDEDYADLLDSSNNVDPAAGEPSQLDLENHEDVHSDMHSDLELNDYALDDARAGKRRRIIDSDTSESDTEEHESDYFERRLVRSIPAATKNYSTAKDVSSLLSDPEPRHVPQHWDIRSQASRGEAQEGREFLDFMPARRNGSRKSNGLRGPNSLDAMTSLSRSEAPGRALKLAARTQAHRKENTSSLRSAQRKTQPSNGAIKHRKASRANQAFDSVGKLFVNQSRETMRTLKKWWKSSRTAEKFDPAQPDFGGNLDTSDRRALWAKENAIHTSRPPLLYPLAEDKSASSGRVHEHDRTKRPGWKYQQVQSRISRTARKMIGAPLEVRSGAARGRIARQDPLGKRSRANKRTGSMRSSAESPVKKALGLQGLKVPTDIPRTALNRAKFDETTLLGSGILELLEGPYVWAGTAAAKSQSKLLTLPELEHAKELEVVNVLTVIFKTCESKLLDRNVFDEIYEHFFNGVAFLCDERHIIEHTFRKFVLREWLRFGRKLLKMSIAHKDDVQSSTPSFRYLNLLVELVSASVLLTYRRAASLGVTRHSESKVNMLIVWTTFYHQWAISLQIDNDKTSPVRELVGCELIAFASHLGIRGSLPLLWERSNNTQANWHLLELFSACEPDWKDWAFARQLLAIDIAKGRGVRTAMCTARKLYLVWGWPVSIEFTKEVFLYYAKQKHYANPHGEAIWLSSFLLTSSFDGNYWPDEEFPMFLELLGYSLKRLGGTELESRRLAALVTPISSLSFPEDEEVSLAGLSSASNQYGILIVLLRMLSPPQRPSVMQFRNLVILKNSHWAIRVKAVSAWSIVVRCVEPAEYLDCRLWMQDEILSGDNVPDPLIFVALKSSIEVYSQATAAVPLDQLVTLGLSCEDEDARGKVWELVQMSSYHFLDDAIPYHQSYNARDYSVIAKLLGSKAAASVNRWYQQGGSAMTGAVDLYLEMLHGATPKIPGATVMTMSLFIEALVRPKPTARDRKLIAAAGYFGFDEQTGRRAALRDLVRNGQISRSQGAEMLRMAAQHVTALAKEPASLQEYTPFVCELRKCVFSNHPSLASEFPPAKQLGPTKLLETMRQNIVSFATHQNSACFYYMTYRLLQYTSLAEPYQSDSVKDGEFIAELMFSTSSPHEEESVRLSNSVFNFVFSGYFKVAGSVYKRTLKNKVSYVLPTLVKAAIASMGRGQKLQYDVFGFLNQIFRYLTERFGVEPSVIEHPATNDLVLLFSQLLILWFNQSHQKGELRSSFAETALRFTDKLILYLQTSPEEVALNVLSPSDLILSESLDATPGPGDDIISAFATDEVDDDRLGENNRARTASALKELRAVIKIYLFSS